MTRLDDPSGILPTGRSVASRAARGMLSVSVRQTLVLLISGGTSLLLARHLDPALFAFYAVSLLLLNVLTLFGDGGLGIALVRQQEPPTEALMSSVATVQFGFCAALAVVGAAVAPILAAAAGTPTGTVALVRLALVALLFTVIQTGPSVRLERDLRFGPLGIVNVVKSAVFNGLSIVLVLTGHGPASFGFALVCQALVGAVLLQALSPGMSGLTLRPAGVRDALAFGVPYQASSVVSVASNTVNPLFVGSILGATGVGYVEWASQLSVYALWALMAMQKVYLPAFARLADNRIRLSSLVQDSLRASNTAVAPLALLTLILAPAAVELVFGHRWAPALPVFRLMWLANLLVPSAGPLIGLLNAIGKSRTTLTYTFAWMMLTWGLSVPLVSLYGLVGFGIANALVVSTNLLMFRTAKRHVDVSIFQAALPAWSTAVVATAPVLALTAVVPPDSIADLVLYAALGLLSYAAVLALTQRTYLHRVRAGIR